MMSVLIERVFLLVECQESFNSLFFFYRYFHTLLLPLAPLNFNSVLSGTDEATTASSRPPWSRTTFGRRYSKTVASWSKGSAWPAVERWVDHWRPARPCFLSLPESPEPIKNANWSTWLLGVCLCVLVLLCVVLHSTAAQLLLLGISRLFFPAQCEKEMRNFHTFSNKNLIFVTSQSHAFHAILKWKSKLVLRICDEKTFCSVKQQHQLLGWKRWVIVNISHLCCPYPKWHP